METMKKLKLPIIVHAYYLKGEFFYKPTEGQVPDASITGEHWLLQNPDFVYRRDYEVTDFLTRRLKDMNGKEEPFLIGAQIKQVKYQENGLNFAKKFQLNEDIVSSVAFRSLIVNFGDELIEILKEKVKTE